MKITHFWPSSALRGRFRKPHGVLVAWIAGVTLCAGDFLMACAIDLTLGPLILAIYRAFSGLERGVSSLFRAVLDEISKRNVP